MKNKRIVIKAGTNVLTANSASLNYRIIENIVSQAAKIKKDGYQVVIITSGAVASGREKLKLKYIKEESIRRQVFAAVGQVYLMSLYQKLFKKYDVQVAQALLVRDDFTNRKRYLNVLQTLEHVLDNNIIPIINENDVITTYESTFGDNDRLAANTAVALSADQLVFLTNIDGLFDGDPYVNHGAKLIKEVKNINNELSRMCSKKSSSLGIGGMLSKINAIKIATKAGILSNIINGLKEDIIIKLLNEGDIGTKFLPQRASLTSRERWFLIGKSSESAIKIDKGAEEALKKRKSLLLVGVEAIVGDFNKNEITEIMNTGGEVIGYGVTNFSSEELKKNMTEKKRVSKEIIHADNLFLS